MMGGDEEERRGGSNIPLYWDELPRSFGSPRQNMVFDPEQLNRLIQEANGRAPVFISHNAYYDVAPDGTPDGVNVTKLFYDLDCKEKPENSLVDARRMALFFRDELGLPMAASFSGMKGNHVYLLLKPERHKLDLTLTCTLRLLGTFFRERLELRTMDMRCCEPRRLCRVWNTRHAKFDRKSGETVVSDLCCIPLSYEEVTTLQFSELVEMARDVHWPRLENPLKKYMTLSRLLEYLEPFINAQFIDRCPNTMEALRTGNIDALVSIFAPMVVQDGIKAMEWARLSPVEETALTRLVEELVPYPCVSGDLVRGNPRHVSRFASVVQLKRLGWSVERIGSFLASLKWIDYSASYTYDQVFQIWYRQPVYKFPRCARLIMEGLCVGPTCKLFHPEWLKMGGGE